MKRLRIEFMFVNCRNDSPTDAEEKQMPKVKRFSRCQWIRSKLLWTVSRKDYNYSPTRPKSTQYTAAKIGNGMEANNAPNFPGGVRRKTKIFIRKALIVSMCSPKSDI